MRIPSVGTPTFQVIARDAKGKEKRVPFASWVPHGAVDSLGKKLDLDGVRSAAVAIKARLKSAVEPLADSHRPRAATFTLREALELHIAGGRASKRIAASTEKNYRDTVRVHLSNWLDRPLVAIGRDDMRLRHLAIGSTCGEAVANNTARIVSACWNRALRQFPELPPSPTANVDRFRLDTRDYGIGEADVPQLWLRISALDAVRADFYRLLLFTGLRRTSAASLRVADVNLKASNVFVAKPKGGERRAFTLPVCNQLQSILDGRLRASVESGSEWMFPAASKSGHLEEPREAGFPPPHAFRHLYGSIAGNLVPAYPLKLLFNHALDRRDVTAGYVKLSTDQLRPHVQAVGDHLWSLIRPGATLEEPSPSIAGDRNAST
jgi:integrase